jgi:hypothetical protein
MTLSPSEKLLLYSRLAHIASTLKATASVGLITDQSVGTIIGCLDTAALTLSENPYELLRDRRLLLEAIAKVANSHRGVLDNIIWPTVEKCCGRRLFEHPTKEDGSSIQDPKILMVADLLASMVFGFVASLLLRFNNSDAESATRIATSVLPDACDWKREIAFAKSIEELQRLPNESIADSQIVGSVLSWLIDEPAGPEVAKKQAKTARRKKKGPGRPERTKITSDERDAYLEHEKTGKRKSIDNKYKCKSLIFDTKGKLGIWPDGKTKDGHIKNLISRIENHGGIDSFDVLDITPSHREEWGLDAIF